VGFRLEDVFGNSWECDCEYPIREFWTEQIRCEFQDNRSQRRWSLRDTLLTSGDMQIRMGPYSRIKGKKPLFATKILSYTFTSAGKKIGLVEMSGLPGNEALWIHPDINIEKGLAISAAAMAFILKNRRSYYSGYTEGLID
ncbi:MAG: hypothetical protein GXO92_04155, partial [FCB group bacterium]|nr:hypothetical protein [FCB group bacterium]